MIHVVVALENMKAEASAVLHAAGVENANIVMDRVRDHTIRDVEKKKLSSNYMDYYGGVKDLSLIHRFRKLFIIEIEMFGYPQSPFALMDKT